MKNIVLIGMPGSGKSTTGVILAKTFGMHFFDTDLLIQEKTGRLLQEIIDAEGTEAFKKIEETVIVSHHFHDAVIATGGSVIYSERAMEHLKKDGMIVYISIPFEEVGGRLRNIETRGIVLGKGRDLHDLYNERVPLYTKYADITIHCAGDFGSCVSAVIDTLKKIRG